MVLVLFLCLVKMEKVVSMEKNLYEQFVSLLREKYPALSLRKVIEDIEDAVERFGIEVKYSDMSHIKASEEISGYVHVVNGVPEMVINGFQSQLRQRFTIAHELGHVLLHWQWQPGKQLPDSLVEISYRKESYSSDNDIQREKQADSFAAEFLAPLDDVVQFLEEIKGDNPDKEVQISMLSDKFKISNSSAFYRWQEAQGVIND